MVYSDKDHSNAVIIFDFPLDEETTIGVDLIEMKGYVNKEVLMRWEIEQPTTIDKAYTVYSSKRELRSKMCD